MDKVKKLKAENAKRNISEIVAEIHDEVNRSQRKAGGFRIQEAL